jgi:hypothetical protein
MTLSSLPTYPSPQRADVGRCIKKDDPALSRRAALILLGLPLLGVLAGALFCAWRILDAIENPPKPPPARLPLDFKLVQERFEQVRLLARRAEVEELLGPPVGWRDFKFQPEFWDFERTIEARPDRYPSGSREWALWIDPKDENKWVAVHYIGGRVYHMLDKGIRPQPANPPD